MSVQVLLCPLCEGRGYVPLGFYSSTAGRAWTVSSTIPDRCRSCDGRGYVVVQSSDESLMPTGKERTDG